MFEVGQILTEGVRTIQGDVVPSSGQCFKQRLILHVVTGIEQRYEHQYSGTLTCGAEEGSKRQREPYAKHLKVGITHSLT